MEIKTFISSLRETKIDGACRVVSSRFQDSKNIAMMEAWCAGKLILRWEDRNGDHYVDSKIRITPTETTEEYDENYDSKSDITVTYRFSGESLVKTEKKDTDFDSEFDFIQTREVSLSSPIGQCSKSSPKSIGSIKNTIFDYRERYSDKWNFVMDTDCPINLKNILIKDMEHGLECLKNQNSLASNLLLAKLKNLIQYSGTPTVVRCDQQLEKNTVAQAISVTAPSRLPEIQISNRYVSDIAKGEYPGIFFHEFLHLIGIRHSHENSDIGKFDAIISCETCCFAKFPITTGYISRSGARSETLLCPYCRGTSLNLEQYQAIMYLYGFQDFRAKYTEVFKKLNLDLIEDKPLRELAKKEQESLKASP